MGEELVQRWFNVPRRDLIQKLRNLAYDFEAAASGQCPLVEAPTVMDGFIGQRAVPCLLGRFENHPTVANGKTGCPSELYWVDETHGIARTFSRWYQLGKRLDMRLLRQAPGSAQ
ncbi:hypothetical protein ACCS95_06745 [Rhizobium ruizarguesonis]